MRLLLRTLAAALLLSALLLAGCSSPGVDRVDVTWNADPPPRWGLYPGYRQEIPCPKGATYTINVFSQNKSFTGGVVGTAGALQFQPTAGSRDIEAQAEDGDHLNIYATLRDTKGAALRLLCLKVERRGEKIWFQFPK